MSLLAISLVRIGTSLVKQSHTLDARIGRYSSLENDTKECSSENTNANTTATAIRTQNIIIYFKCVCVNYASFILNLLSN